jgi:hypothetical protein
MTTSQTVYFIFLCGLFFFANWIQRSIGYHKCLNNIKNAYPDIYKELTDRSQDFLDKQ